MDTPGFDPVSVTGLIAGGVKAFICFTTGRGTVLGSVPAPTLKLASNGALYRRMAGDMDVNCGRVLDEGLSIRRMGDRVRARPGDRVRAKDPQRARGAGAVKMHPSYVGAVVLRKPASRAVIRRARRFLILMQARMLRSPIGRAPWLRPDTWF